MINLRNLLDDCKKELQDWAKVRDLRSLTLVYHSEDKSQIEYIKATWNCEEISLEIVEDNLALPGRPMVFEKQCSVETDLSYHNLALNIVSIDSRKKKYNFRSVFSSIRKMLSEFHF